MHFFGKFGENNGEEGECEGKSCLSDLSLLSLSLSPKGNYDHGDGESKPGASVLETALWTFLHPPLFFPLPLSEANRTIPS